MPAQLQQGDWQAAFLAEPYVTKAEETYGEQELADLDQGATVNFPIDGYVATQAWAQKHPKTAAAFVRAIEEGQTLADNDPTAVRAAMAVVGPADARRDRGHGAARISRSARSTKGACSAPLRPCCSSACSSQQYATEVEQGTLVKSMIGP